MSTVSKPFVNLPYSTEKDRLYLTNSVQIVDQ